MARKVITKICEYCGKGFLTDRHNKNFCSDECKYLNTQKRKNKTGKIYDETNSVKCVICGKRLRQIHKHVQIAHGLTLDEYKEKYNLETKDCYAADYLKSNSDKMKGENNPGFEHGGRLSSYSKKFVKYEGLSEEEKQKQIDEIADKSKQTRKEHPENRSTRIEFWLAQGFSEEEAREKLSERQRTFTLEKCIERHGEEAGTKIWKARQKKWQETLNSKDPDEIARINILKGKGGSKISKAEYEIFEILKDKGFEVAQQSRVSSRAYFYDIMIGNKIIEYNGDYWHMNPKKFQNDDFNSRLNMLAEEKWGKDAEKINHAIECGYEVMIIWERDFKKDREAAIQKCLEFIGN